MASGQVWVTSSLGGFLTAPELSRNLRYQAQPLMVARQFIRPEVDFGQNSGDTLLFEKVSNVAVQGRVVAETERTPETNITIFQDQMVAQEYTNSIPYTWTLEILAKLDINSMLIESLKNDMAKTLDKAAGSQFQAASFVYTPTGTETNRQSVFNTNGTATGATRNMAAYDMKNIVDKMQGTYFIPLYDGKNYIGIETTTFQRGLKDDTEWIDAAKFGDPDRLFSGEVGEYYGVRNVKETNFLNNALANGLGEGVIFGWDPVIEIAVYPEEIQAKIGYDYGRDRGLRWVWVGAFKLTWNFALQGDSRIVHVTST